jgi:omega-amidase
MTLVSVAVIQSRVVTDKHINLDKAIRHVNECAQQGAQVIVLPEMFTCPYSTQNFPLYAEREGGSSWTRLAECARANQIYLVGGSIPEIDDSGRVYNTCFIFDPEGKQIGKHRKMHMFDIAVRGGQTFRESDTLTPGDRFTVVETKYCRIGVAVCYDLRFPELARLMVQDGAKVLMVPGAFNMTTGPAHWEILFRARAVDNQVFVCGCAPARDEQAGYVSYGNSLVVSPWGEVVRRLGAEEGTIIETIDLDTVEKIREQLPLLKQRRLDLYDLRFKQ